MEQPNELDYKAVREWLAEKLQDESYRIQFNSKPILKDITQPGDEMYHYESVAEVITITLTKPSK